jgi:hypothetical protein
MDGYWIVQSIQLVEFTSTPEWNILFYLGGERGALLYDDLFFCI